MPLGYGDSYSVGTISIANGSVNFTGTGTFWLGVPLRPGDTLGAGGLQITIATITEDGVGTIAYPWPGTSLVDEPYSIRLDAASRHEPTTLVDEVRTLVDSLLRLDNARRIIAVKQFGVNTPPVDAEEGDQFIVGTAPTGDFTGHANEVAEKKSVGYAFEAAEEGDHSYDEEDDVVYNWDGTAWNQASGLASGFRPQGEWKSTDTYQPGDGVTRFGIVYAARVVTTNEPPEANSDPEDPDRVWNLYSRLPFAGGAVVLHYIYRSPVADADPGAGNFRLSHGPDAGTLQRMATRITLDDLDVAGIDNTLLLADLVSGTSTKKADLRLVSPTDLSKRLHFTFTAVSSQSGYQNLTVGPVNIGVASPFSDGDEVLLIAQRNGDKGDIGSQGIQGLRGPAGGPIAIEYTVDANSTEDSDPSAGTARFNQAVQNTTTVLRVSTQAAAGGGSVSELLARIPTSSTSDIKAIGRLFATADPTKWMTFDILSLASPAGYRNITIVITGSSSTSPFAHGMSVTLAWVPKGDKGDTATVAVNSVDTGEPGTAASVVNVGTAQAALLDFTLPRGDTGDSFDPVHVVANLAARDAYDEGPVFDENDRRLSVLVEEDSSNSDLPTLYFLLVADNGVDPAEWSEGFTYQTATALSALTYDNSESGMTATTGQQAVDELSERVDSIPDPVAMSFIFGGL